MLVIGLTGGIGSGKTRIANLFVDKGIPVYIADIEAKKLMNTDKEIIQKIQKEFGELAYDEAGLNRKYLANQVFGNPEKLAQLNAIVHPAVHKHFLQYKANQKAPFIIYENAILFENGSDTLCDFIITVTAPESLRIQRVMQRDAVSKEQVLARIQHQLSDTEKINKSDFVIENIDWDTTEQEFLCVYKELLFKSKTIP